MKKSYLLLLLLNFTVYIAVNAMSEQELREDFFKVVHDWSKAESLLKKIKAEKNVSALFIAYEGSCEVIVSGNQPGFFSRLEYVKSGLRKLDKAIALSPQNLEIRFLRFSVQHNIPSIICLSNNLEVDKNFILKNCHSYLLKNFKSDQLDYMVNFMELSGRCTKEEIAELKKIVYGK